jgi:hypothetical protein
MMPNLIKTESKHKRNIVIMPAVMLYLTLVMRVLVEFTFLHSDLKNTPALAGTLRQSFTALATLASWQK